MENVKTPELDKMLAVKDKSQEIGAFLDSLSEQGYAICEHKQYGEDEWDGPSGYHPVRKNIEQLLAEYFNIDLKKCEEERQAILASLK